MLQGFAADVVVGQGSGVYRVTAGAMPAGSQWETTVGGRHPWSQQLSGQLPIIAETAEVDSVLDCSPCPEAVELDNEHSILGEQ